MRGSVYRSAQPHEVRGHRLHDGEMAVRTMHRNPRVDDMPYHRQAHAEQPGGEPIGVNGACAMSGEVNVRFIALHIKFDGTQGPVHG